MSEKFTVREVAERWGVSRQRVHQVMQQLEVQGEWCGPIRVLGKRDLRRMEKFREKRSAPLDKGQASA